MTLIGRLSSLATISLALCALTSAPAWAQPTPTPFPADKPAPAPPPPTQEQLEQAKAAFAAGKAFFDEKKFEEAAEKFKESYRLSRNPVLLYNIGFTFDQLGKKDLAVIYYKKFLSDAPADAAQRGEVTPRLKVLEKELAKDVPVEVPPTETGTPPTETGNPPDGGKKPPRKPPPAGGYTEADFEHQIVEDAPPGRPLDLTSFAPEESGWIVTLFYRGGGDAKFTSVQMKPRYNELVGRIPAQVMQGSSVQYYLEVRDTGGKMITRVGRPASPNIVYIDPKARPRYYPDLTDDRDWVEPPPGGGGGVVIGGGNGGGSSGGGYFDAGTKNFKRTKWIATGVGLGTLGVSLTFYLMAADLSSTLEGEAANANSKRECDPDPRPCKEFTTYRQDVEAAGKRNELVSRITFGVGIAATGFAAYLWYRELSSTKKSESKVVATPVVSDEYVGGAAMIRF